MLSGIFVEVSVENGLGVRYSLLCRKTLELKEETFTQVAGANSSGVELLNAPEHRRYLFVGHHQVMGEGEVVGYRSHRPPQISVVVEASNNLLTDQLFLFAQAEQTKLLNQVFMEAVLHTNGNASVVVVVAVVVISQSVIGYIIVIDVFRQILLGLVFPSSASPGASEPVSSRSE